ncbi:MAG: hypothetical protein HYY93_16080 [Planctomycetes bacterium]|nr:hypothetical protein [Planctomycetota bacterium]
MTNSKETPSILGIGIYTIPEAARLTGVSLGRVRRWIAGYHYDYGKGRVDRPPVWRADIGTTDGGVCLSFLDLLEVFVVDQLRSRRVAWTTIHDVGKKAAEELRTNHPFCTQRFVTLGRTLLLDALLPTEDRALLDLVSHQLHFHRLLDPFLENLDFGARDPQRWWPTGRDRCVVIDPARSFGAPIVETKSVPTIVLSEAVRGGHSESLVAGWYGIPVRAVRDAVRFEESLAA